MGSLQEQYLSSGPSFRGFSSTGSSVSTYNKDGLSLVRHEDTTDQSEEQYLHINQSNVRTTAYDQSETRVMESDQPASIRFSQTNQSDGTNSHNYYGDLSRTLLGSERFNNRESSSGEFFDLATGSSAAERGTASVTQTTMKNDEVGGDNDDRDNNMSTLVLQEDDDNNDHARYGYVVF